MVSPLVLLREHVEDEGYEPGTPQFDARLVFLRVEKCMELQAVTRCGDCRAYLDCPLLEAYSRLKVFGITKPE